MKALQELPEGFRQIFSVNLQKDKKAALIVNFAALLIAVVMAVPMHFHISVFTMFDFSDGIGMYFLRFGVFLLYFVAYIILHEAVHGIAMKYFGSKHVKYGFTGLYAFAGCDDYFDKKSYIIIALAPIVVWGIVLAVICAVVPESWFWVAYWVQISNISGAAGDIYVTVKFSKMPKDILITDSGIEMKVFSAE